jgi:ParD-like antitoxin of type II bacterial toxin-antitoxin system
MDTIETLPPVSVKLPGELVRLARQYAALEERSVPKQIEYWAKIGRIAKENPDLPLSFIEGALEGMQQLDNKDVESFEFQHIKPKHAYRTLGQVQENL